MSVDNWEEALAQEYKKDYYKELYIKVNEEYKNYQIFPPKEKIMTAYKYTPLKNVKVVILGQDPYHNYNQAEGLSFSVRQGIKIPPSLQNIYKELHDDLGCKIPNNGSLVPWAKEGVFLLNTVLTVRAHEANSHQNIGWEKFTDATIKVLAKEDRPIVFLLWGSSAIKKKSLLGNNKKHLILTAPHPSPLSSYRGFFGCKHFSKTNEFLIKNGLEPINWQIPDC